jgi:hypothetical protein
MTRDWDTAAFALAGVGEGGLSVAWPGEIDMGAARLLEVAFEQNGRADAVEFIRWRWKHGLSLTDVAEALGLSRRQVAYYASGQHECRAPSRWRARAGKWSARQRRKGAAGRRLNWPRRKVAPEQRPTHPYVAPLVFKPRKNRSAKGQTLRCNRRT